MNLFEILYIAGYIGTITIRVVYGIRRKKANVEERRPELPVSIASIVWLFGSQIIPFLYIGGVKWFDFADYSLPSFVGWIGVGVFVLSLWLLWRSHTDLGRNWSPTLEVQNEQSLVTDGVYRHMRHPMYSAHFVWGIAQILLLHNWIAGWGGLLTFVPVYLLRYPPEEQMMIDTFGEEYRDYMTQTGRIFPKVSGSAT